MAVVTIAREQLHRVPVESGGELIFGVFMVTLTGTYIPGGETVDLTGFMKQVIDLNAQCIDPLHGYVLAVDGAAFATARARIIMLWDRPIPGVAGVAAGVAVPAIPAIPGGVLVEASGVIGTVAAPARVRCVVWGLG